MSGASFGNGLKAGYTGAGMGLIGGGIMGGISGGINSAIHNGNFLTGDGMTQDYLAPTNASTKTITVGSDVKFTQKFADDFSNLNFETPTDDNVSNLYADGSTPKNYTYSGDEVLNVKGKPCYGTSVYHKAGSDVYIYKAAFVSKEQLFETMFHEYAHTNFDKIGWTNSDRQHAAIYKFQLEQANQWSDINLIQHYQGMYNDYQQSFFQSYYNKIFKFGFYSTSIHPLVP